MNVGQNIFLIFYAVLFGTMLSGTGGLHAFPWGFFYESPSGVFRLLWRLLMSIVCLYLLPAAIFGISFSVLAAYPSQLGSVWHAPVLVFSALSVFAPYRLFLFLMIGLRATPLRLYSRAAFEDIAAQRHIRRSALGHFLSVVFFGALVWLDFWVVKLL